MSSPTKEELDELFSWFQGVNGALDTYKELNSIKGENNDNEVIKKIQSTLANIETSLDNIGKSLGIKPSEWNAMTHDKRLLTIYEKLPCEKDDFKQAAPHLFRTGGKRNKSKKPKRRNSRSKRRKTVSKRRR